MKGSFLRHALGLAAAAAPMLTGVAAAQNVGEVTVFAQKREQRLQDIPVAVSAFNSQTLADAGVKDIKDLTILTPGLLVTSTSNETVTTARVRGVGTVGDNPGLESSVGVVIDGVYRPRNGVGFGDLGEIERIEVLKGPQGTLFGKNTSAGVIQVFTKRPQYDWGFDGEATIGEYGTRGIAGSLTGPIFEDKAAFRIYGAQRKREGFYDVARGGGPRRKDDDNDQDFYTVRGQLLFEPTAAVSINLIADFSSRDESCCAAVTIPSVNTGPNANATARVINLLMGSRGTGIDVNKDPFDRLAFSNRDTDQRVEDQGFSAEVNADLGFADLTYVSAIRSWDLVAAQDADFSALDIWYRPNTGANGNRFDTVSQELRLQGTVDNIASGLDWLVGAFYANEQLENKASLLYGTDYRTYWTTVQSAFALVGGFVPTGAFAPGAGTRDRHEQEDRTYAFFTQNSLRLTDRLELTGGIRYTSTNKSVDSVYQTTGGACDGFRNNTLVPSLVAGLYCQTWMNEGFDRLGLSRQKLSEKETTGTAKIAFDVTDDILTFASYSKGYKAGGFNLDRENRLVGTDARGAPIPDTDTTFKPEFVDSYELGVKTTWLGGRLIVNGSAFYNKFSDFQLNTFLGTVFVVQSVPEVTSRGVEFDSIWQTPIEGLNLQLAATYSNTEYGNFNVGPASALLPDNTMSFAPDFTISGGVSYERDILQNLRLRTSVNGRYVDDYATASDLLPSKDQEAFLLLNGRIGISTADERYSLELWGQNLTDEEYYQVGFNGPLQGSATGNPPALVVGGNPRYIPANDTITYKAFLGAPRVVGATFRLKY